GFVEVLAARPPEGSGRQFDFPALEWLDVLNASLAVAAFANDQGPAVILEARRDNFAAAGRVAIYHADHREIEVTALVRPRVVLFLPISGPDGDDETVIDEHVGNLDGTLQ